MNEILLRRLVGAGVLLVLAFGLASLLPKNHPGLAPPPAGDPVGPRQVVRYDLQGGAPVGLKLDPKLQEQPDPPAVAAPVNPPPPELEPEEAPQAPAEKPKPASESVPAPAPKPAPARSQGGWFVQVGSFADPVNARGVRDRLVAQRLAATVQEVRVGRALWYRVRVGPVTDESAAKKALEKIQRLEFRGARIVHE